jgi:hypothetical protein
VRSARAGSTPCAPAWARASVLVAALLAVLAWPATRIHEATVQHAVCVEHGEIIDLADATHSAPVEEGERWRPAFPDEEVHEHCPFLGLGQPGDSTSAVPIREARFVAPARWLRPLSEDRFASVPLLCLAPKQSPPV